MNYISKIAIGTVLICVQPVAFSVEGSGKHQDMHGHHEKEMIQRHPALSAQGLKEAGSHPKTGSRSRD